MASKAKTVSKTELEKDKLRAEIAKTELDTELAELQVKQLASEIRDQDASEDAALTYTFHSDVDEDSVKDCISVLSLWSRRNPGEDFTITFTSPGGYVADGLALYDFIQELKHRGHHVTTVGLGWAASMGAVLLQAGTHRVVGPNSYIMIHEVSGGAIGKSSKLKDAAKWAEELTDRLAGILAANTNVTKEEILTRSDRRDWFIWPEEALQLGFVDEIRSAA